MSVFKAILKSLKANIVTIIVYLAIFTIFGNMQAKANASTQDTAFEEVTITVAIKDNDNSKLSKAIVNYLEETQNVVSPKTDDPMIMNDNTRFSIYDYALIIPDGFESKVLSGETENLLTYIAPETTASQFLLTEKLNDYLQDIVIYLNSGYSEDEAISLAHEQLINLNETTVTIIDESDKNHRSFFSGMFLFNGYTLLMILSICCATVVTFMKNKDVSNRISVSGMHFFTRNAAAISGVFFIGTILTTFAILVILVIGSGNDNKFWFYAIDTYSLMFVGLGLAYFICSLTANENLINMVANMVVLSMSFLCGVFVDTQFLSASIIKAAHFMPLYWYTTAIKFINDTPVGNIWCGKFVSYLVIEILFALVFFTAGMIVSRKKEQYAI